MWYIMAQSVVSPILFNHIVRTYRLTEANQMGITLVFGTFAVLQLFVFTLMVISLITERSIKDILYKS